MLAGIAFARGHLPIEPADPRVQGVFSSNCAFRFRSDDPPIAFERAFPSVRSSGYAIGRGHHLGGSDLAKRRGLSDVVAAALIAAATNAPITAYVAYTHHIEEMARIAGEAEKRTSEATNVSQTKILEVSQARCSAALQFLAHKDLNPSLKPVEAQALLTDMRQVADQSCNSTLPYGSSVAQAQPQNAKESQR